MTNYAKWLGLSAHTINKTFNVTCAFDLKIPGYDFCADSYHGNNEADNE